MARSTNPTFVGRTSELASLDHLIEATADGRGQVAIVEGEAGIGKTRLVAEFVERAQSSGWTVRAADCNELERSSPFAAIARALAIDVDASEFRVVETLGSLVERLAVDDPLVVVVEDIHWADIPTLAALRSIERRTRHLPVLMLVTCRAGHHVAEVHGLIDELLRGGATRIVIGPLGPDAVARLAAELTGTDPSRDLLARLAGATGNPLFITEYLRSFEDPPGANADDAGRVPVEFRLIVLRRLAQLSAPANDVLRMASVLGSVLSLAELSIALDRSAVELMPLVQEAVGRGVIGEVGEQLAFRHDLVRQAIYEHMPLEVRRHLHYEIGERLAAANVRPLAVAHHLALGAEAPDAEAADWLRRAASEAAPSGPAVAVELLERARDLLGEFAPERDALLAELVMALAGSGRLTEAESLALEILGRGQRPEVAGKLRCGIVYALTWQGRFAEALKYTVVSPDEELDERDAVLLLAEAAHASLLVFDVMGAATRAAQAAGTAEALKHDLALCHALGVQAWTSTMSGQPNEGAEFARRAIEVADRSTDGQAFLAHPRFFPGMPLCLLDRLDEAEEVLQTGRRRAEDMGLAWSLPMYHSHIGVSRFLAGEWDAAVAEFDAGLVIADEVGLHHGAMTAASAWLAVIQLHRDDLAGAAQTLGDALRRLAESGGFAEALLNWARALFAEAHGKPSEALSLLEPAWELSMATGQITDPWSASALVRLLLSAGEPGRAAALLPLIDQHTAAGTASMKGRALQCRGLVEENVEMLVRAAAAYRESPRRLERAAAIEDAGVALARAERPTDAIPLLEEANSIYDEIGADRDVARVRAELRTHGITRGARGAQARANHGWDALTKTELRVVALIAEGLSNPDVARRLFVSRHTVESHLKRVYRKLSLGSRLELAAEARRH